MKTLNRRDFLKLGASGLALSTLAPVVRPGMLTQLVQAGTIPDRKIFVIFLRGGNDGVNTVIPHGDSEYNTTNRPTLFIPDTTSLDLMNGFARLHPAMTGMHNQFLSGNVACLHRVGYPDQSRSHFNSQQYWENGEPGADALQEGWLYRYIVDQFDVDADPLTAASISNQLMLLFKGPQQLTHFPSIDSFDMTAPGSPDATKLLGELPGPDIGSGMLGWYGQAGTGHGYDTLIKEAGTALGSALNALEMAGVDPATYVPANGACYPSQDDPCGFPAGSFPFFAQVRDAAMLLKLTDLRIAGVEIGGWDTHANQAGTHAALLSYISHAVETLSQDLASQWGDLLVLTCSEFGRTSKENGSVGTDHGESSVVFAAGGNVNGGVYNCDATTWANGDMLSTANGRYVERSTDFRAVMGEALVKHMGLSLMDLDLVFPGYSSFAGDPTFDFLNYLP